MSLGCHVPKEGGKDSGIREKGVRIKVMVKARLPTSPQKSQHRRDVTQEVMDCVGTMDGQGEDTGEAGSAADDAREAGGPRHTGTGSLASQAGAVQRPADGSVLDTGHNHKQSAFSNANRIKKYICVKQQAGGMVGQEERSTSILGWLWCNGSPPWKSGEGRHT